jgi:hypothetical protein
MCIISRQVILCESPKFGLVLRNDVEIGMNRPFFAVSFSTFFILSCLVLHLPVRNAKSDAPINAALPALVMFRVLLQNMNVITEKSRFLRLGFNFFFDLNRFLFWTGKTNLVAVKVG